MKNFFLNLRSFLLTLSTLLLLLSTLPLSKSYAQTDATSTNALSQPITDLSIVLGCGLGGAVLGLSTLSFVDRPSKHFL
ncbi:MAG: hypothetical protein HQK50_19085, partial [Oligoflexia bacterium]|nr:hypothetical protein [Oligoflexia bacterium]